MTTAVTATSAIHYHTERGIADAALEESRRRNRSDLAGDIYCRALHESRDGRRDGYSTARMVRLAAGHVLQDEQRQRERHPPTLGGDSTLGLTRRDPGSHTIDSIEFGEDVSAAINARQAARHAARTIRAIQFTAEIRRRTGHRTDSGATHSPDLVNKPDPNPGLYSRLARLATLDRLFRERGERLRPFALVSR